MTNRHAEKIREYSEDWIETDEPFLRWKTQNDGCPVDKGWVQCDRHPFWHEHYNYMRMPKTININGYKVPQPVRESLSCGSKYYSFDLFDKLFTSEWSNHWIDKKRLDLGFIHSTREGAEKHFKALLSFTEKKDD